MYYKKGLCSERGSPFVKIKKEDLMNVAHHSLQYWGEYKN